MSNVVQALATSAMKSINQQMEESIRAVLNEIIPGWDLEDVKSRLKTQEHFSLPGWTLLILDEQQAIIAFGPLEFTNQQVMAGAYRMQVTQQVCRLWSKPI